MALVRQTLPTLDMGPLWIKKHRTVVTWAGVIAALFGAMAFLFLVWRDHGHPKIMLNEQSAPVTASVRSAPGTSVPVAKQRATQPGEALQNSGATSDSSPKHEFSMSKSSTERQIGSVRLKLTKTDPSKKIYDMRVITGRRWSTRRHLKINEPFWIANNRGAGAIEMIATSITSDSVAGYWMESKRSAHISPRVRSKRR
jgi:hypothetical protein